MAKRKTFSANTANTPARKSVAAARKKTSKATKVSKAPHVSKVSTKSTKRKAPSKQLAGAPQVDLSSLKVAIVCDWLTGTGGAERVVLELHRLFKNAPIYTSQYDSNPKIWYGDKWFADADIRSGYLQRLPPKLKKFLPVLRARYFSSLDLSEYDLVIVSSSAEAKAIKTGPNTKVVWYCHAPTHYYWSRYNAYLQHPGFGALDPVARAGLFALVRPLRKWDYRIAQKPDFVIANSSHTATEVKKYYGRDSTVVFPPVDTRRFAAEIPHTHKQPHDRYGFVVAGRQTPYKKIDLAVEACSRLRLPLTVIGNGPEHNKLGAVAGSTVRFLNKVTDAEMARHFKLANAFIFPGIDDFGIVAVEALSAGTPVIAYKAGGALDYVKQGVTGSFFEHQTPESLMKTLSEFNAKDYNSNRIVEAAQQYSVDNFSKNFMAALQSFLASQTK